MTPRMLGWRDSCVLLFACALLPLNQSYSTGAGSCYGPIAGHGPPSYLPGSKVTRRANVFVLTHPTGGFTRVARDWRFLPRYLNNSSPFMPYNVLAVETDPTMYVDRPSQISIKTTRCPYVGLATTPRMCESLLPSFRGFLILVGLASRYINHIDIHGCYGRQTKANFTIH